MSKPRKVKKSGRFFLPDGDGSFRWEIVAYHPYTRKHKKLGKEFPVSGTVDCSFALSDGYRDYYSSENFAMTQGGMKKELRHISMIIQGLENYEAVLMSLSHVAGSKEIEK